MHKKENHPSLGELKASSAEGLSEGPRVHFYPRNRTVCGSAPFWSREAGKVSIPMIWHTPSKKKLFLSVFEPI